MVLISCLWKIKLFMGITWSPQIFHPHISMGLIKFPLSEKSIHTSWCFVPLIWIMAGRVCLIPKHFHSLYGAMLIQMQYHQIVLLKWYLHQNTFVEAIYVLILHQHLHLIYSIYGPIPHHLITTEGKGDSISLWVLHLRNQWYIVKISFFRSAWLYFQIEEWFFLNSQGFVSVGCSLNILSYLKKLWQLFINNFLSEDIGENNVTN